MITLEEAAERLGVDAGVIRRWVESGLVESDCTGDRVVVASNVREPDPPPSLMSDYARDLWRLVKRASTGPVDAAALLAEDRAERADGDAA
jgi:hypothetical protein